MNVNVNYFFLLKKKSRKYKNSFKKENLCLLEKSNTITINNKLIKCDYQYNKL